jgi:hypothetical protein
MTSSPDPTLELFATPLTGNDLATLDKSYITPDLAKQAGIFRVDSHEGAELVGRNGRGDYSGIVFPYRWPGEENPREYRLRRDHPDMERDSKGELKPKQKYLSAPGAGNKLYFPPGVNPTDLQNVDLPVVLVEGEKKALAIKRLCDEGYLSSLSIAIPGVWNWRGTIGKTVDEKGARCDEKGPIPDLDRIAWHGRTVYIFFDVNVDSNDSVKNARRNLTYELQRRGAKVHHVKWTKKIEGINGPDDLLALDGYGPAFVATMIQAAPLANWPDPEEFPDDLLPVPALKPELLPAALRDWIVDIADRMQCPIEFPAITAIIALASVVGNSVRIRPKKFDSWTVTPNLWGGIIAPPGYQKTPAREAALKPLKSLERTARAEYAKEMEDYEFKLMCAEGQRKALEKKIRIAIEKGDDTEAFKDDLKNTVAKKPVERRYVVNDPTVEKLGELLNENPNGLLLDRDELVGWFRSLEKDGHDQDRAFYLECWGGSGSYVYDRIGRGTVRIDNLTVSILGGIQPGPLRSYLHAALRQGVGDDGLMQRFQLLVYPDPPKTWRNVDRMPSLDATATADNCFFELDQLKPQDIGAIEVKEHDETIYFLRFDPAAQAFFDLWRADLETTLRDGSLEHAALEGHLAKFRSLMPSLALIFHLVDVVHKGVTGDVSLESAKRAAMWCSFLEAHARRIYGLALTGEIRLAKAILKKIRSGQLPVRFTARDIYRKQWAGLSTPADLSDPLRVLVDYGYINPITTGKTLQGGRSTITYLAHPSLIAEAQP